MMRKKTVSIITMLCMIVSLLGCSIFINDEDFSGKYYKKVPVDIMIEMMTYAMFMNFETRPIERKSPMEALSDLDIAVCNHTLGLEDEQYSDFILVHTAEEAEGVGEDILVAWPGEFTDITLEGINGIISLFFNEEHSFYEHKITIPTPLIHPITKEDLVEHWQLVWEFLWELKHLDNNAYALLIFSRGDGRRARRRAITDAQAIYNDYTAAEETYESDGCQ